ncbi:hypothetical protein BABINDRAFT_163716 [Babjeviella inositovora NRRL Y-12698]|uniref:Uncharacterized protein n=1 Tax=Babjeviella inositovora NRRL Y-12698 TaxID=984486 RepID=A0A1E3QHP2_9ASCO|nr:uncharacterized protein BABINDRAFT_163716 [Babjeviella inositovora NRRL Y-12698]ODQ77211.1 hypothetical protein BABINDRAFT_163716 [Babjeviella inositovora NRRL Y-12698]
MDLPYTFSGWHPSSWSIELFYLKSSACGKYSQTHINQLVKDYLSCLLHYKSALSSSSPDVSRMFLQRDVLLRSPDWYLSGILNTGDRFILSNNETLVSIVSALNYFKTVFQPSGDVRDSVFIDKLNTESYWPRDEEVCNLTRHFPQLSSVLPIDNILDKIDTMLETFETDVEKFCRSMGWVLMFGHDFKHPPYRLQLNAVDENLSRKQFEAEAALGGTISPLDGGSKFKPSRKRPVSDTDFDEYPYTKRLQLCPV